MSEGGRILLPSLLRLPAVARERNITEGRFNLLLRFSLHGYSTGVLTGRNPKKDPSSVTVTMDGVGR